jgi:hypothetical protein
MNDVGNLNEVAQFAEFERKIQTLMKQTKTSEYILTEHIMDNLLRQSLIGKHGSNDFF